MKAAPFIPCAFASACFFLTFQILTAIVKGFVPGGLGHL